LDAADRDIQREEQNRKAEEPFPKITRLEGFFATELVWVERRIRDIEDSAAAEFGNAAEQIEIWFAGGKFG
jgi:hypothetical protein